MTIGDRRHIGPQQLARGTHHPLAPLRVPPLATPLATAYSYSQHVGHRVGEWFAPLDPERLLRVQDPSPAVPVLGFAGQRIVPDHWDRIDAFMSFVLGPTAEPGLYDLRLTFQGFTSTIGTAELDPASPDYPWEELIPGHLEEGLWVLEGALDLEAPNRVLTTFALSVQSRSTPTDITAVSASVWATSKGASE